MTKRHKERLLKLAAFLRTVPNKFFNLEVLTAGGDGKDFDPCGLKKLDHKCGSVACAMGWCPIVFPRTFRYNSAGGVEGKDENISIKSFFGLDKFEKLDVYGDLEESARDYLFMPQYYPRDKRGPKSVAARIERFVKSDGKYTLKDYDDDGSYDSYI